MHDWVSTSDSVQEVSKNQKMVEEQHILQMELEELRPNQEKLNEVCLEYKKLKQDMMNSKAAHLKELQDSREHYSKVVKVVTEHQNQCDDLSRKLQEEKDAHQIKIQQVVASLQHFE